MLLQYTERAIDEAVEKASTTDQIVFKNINSLPAGAGRDYEIAIAEIIRRTGWTAELTQEAGDNGADIVATKNSIHIVVQCKFYTGSVGNRSVQEVYSALAYYDADYACVVTNSYFTPSAKLTAKKLIVTLLHHDEIESFLSKVESNYYSYIK